MKQVIRLTESDLRRIVKESVQRILNEYNEDQYKVLDKLDIGIRRVGAEAQYGNQDNASGSEQKAKNISWYYGVTPAH